MAKQHGYNALYTHLQRICTAVDDEKLCGTSAVGTRVKKANKATGVERRLI